jgi:hypothetical protein
MRKGSPSARSRVPVTAITPDRVFMAF